MRTLSVLGTAAMFLVGGSIVLHGIPPLAHAIEAMLASINSGVAKFLASTAIDFVVGVIVGGIVHIAVTLATKLLGRK
jgi:uncharacterized protein